MAGYFPILWVHYNLLIFLPLAIQPFSVLRHLQCILWNIFGIRGSTLLSALGSFVELTYQTLLLQDLVSIVSGQYQSASASRNPW